MTLGDRIKAVRKSAGLTQIDFGRRLQITGSSVSTMESGKSNPSRQTLAMICAEFGVSEDWLISGTGDMLAPVSAEEQISDFVSDILTSRPDIRRRVISALARLHPEDWALIENLLDRIAGEDKTAGPE